GDLELDLPHDLLCHCATPWSWRPERPGLPQSLDLLDLHEVEFDRRGPAEDRNEHPESALLGADFLHRAVEAREGSVDDANGTFGAGCGAPSPCGEVSRSTPPRLTAGISSGGRPPTKPDTRGVVRTRCQAFGVISISTMM